MAYQMSVKLVGMIPGQYILKWNIPKIQIFNFVYIKQRKLQ